MPRLKSRLWSRPCAPCRGTVCDTRPIVVEYEVTNHSRTLREVVQALRAWGARHHDTVIGKKRPDALIAEPAS